MKQELFSWPRPRFVPGGGDAMVSYRVFGDFSRGEPEISPSRHNSNGVPAGIDAGVMHNKFWNWDEAQQEALRHSNPAAWEILKTTPEVLVLFGEIPDPDSLDYLRDTTGVVAAALENGGVCVVEEQISHLSTAREWLDTYFADGFEPTQHTVILLSPEPDPNKVWLHTRGMRLFGRPDVSCHGVAPEEVGKLEPVFNGLIRMQAAGAIIPDGQIVQAVGIENRLICRHAGDSSDPDFSNCHLELEWETPRP